EGAPASARLPARGPAGARRHPPPPRQVLRGAGARGAGGGGVPGGGGAGSAHRGRRGTGAGSLTNERLRPHTTAFAIFPVEPKHSKDADASNRAAVARPDP